MRKRLWNVIKKATVACMATVLLGTMGGIPKEAKAAAGTDEVQFVKVAYDTFQSLIEKKEAPVYDKSDFAYGYLFGGWYAGENEETPIKELSAVKEGTDVYAKYVPAYVMGVKCQNHFQAATSQTTSMRIVSSIDSASYKEVGVSVRRITLSEGGACETVTELGRYSAKAYSGKFSIYDAEGKIAAGLSPKQVFGAKSQYFTAVRLINIKNYDMLLCIRPYWVTLDGTTVEGLSRYIRVNDGVQGYVSIPINLKSAIDVAAGLVTVDYSTLAKAGYRLDTVEGGMLFKEMEMGNDETTHTLKCVGNVDNISVNVQSDDILASLRFKAPENSSRTYAEDTFYSLTVKEADFTDIDESIFDKYMVWNVQY